MLYGGYFVLLYGGYFVLIIVDSEDDDEWSGDFDPNVVKNLFRYKLFS